ncbi:nucleoside diphosphate kinase regulator [Rhodovulum sulfidophilum]|uniref:nucleoside diphosphate kinase regulator n=1 Tax=Rhodovulum sulfidophilum TaxID=35806 RepID=UPI0009520D53|nr:nucleoside diphosphate kinase regulator [Rhodovulum sulfidophilum]MBL3554504.1 nucleoside diphosphate kinase regulator [Rhodovulum sulfidophilum]OLS48902.1 nucleoside-diphosphate kinase [Rhodovulum sulfidophilum]
MSTSTEATQKPFKRNPKIAISADDLARLQGLADSMALRQPALADRLLEEIGRARIVAPAKIRDTVVTMGSKVTYRDEISGQEKEVTLVYPEEADITNLCVSVMTPIGVALLGLSEGASFHWETRDDQRRTLTVLSVTPPPENTKY